MNSDNFDMPDENKQKIYMQRFLLDSPYNLYTRIDD